MSLEISRDTETRLNSEARKHGISVDALLERFMSEHVETDTTSSQAELPVLHLGPMGALHRRDIYDDVR